MTEGGDMIAKDILVHNSCRAAYISKQNILYAQSETQTEGSIYENAFQKVVDVVEQRVINGQEVLQMKDLVHQMNTILTSYNCNFVPIMVIKITTAKEVWYKDSILATDIPSRI